MTERVEVVADVDLLQMQPVAMARNWFESQAAEFRGAQALIVRTNGDVDDIIRQRDAVDTETERSICMKAIDALNKTRDLQKIAKLEHDTDIYRHHARSAAIALLGQRAAAAMVRADHSEQKYLDSE